MDVDERCHREVVDLHRFFEQWFNGIVANDDDAFARFADVLASQFRMVAPTGAMMERDTILDVVRHGHGSCRERAMEIRIVDHRHRLTHGDQHLVTYEEWQTRDGAPRGRLSTALLADDPDGRGPNGLRWMHVHETWTDAAAAPPSPHRAPLSVSATPVARRPGAMTDDAFARRDALLETLLARVVATAGTDHGCRVELPGDGDTIATAAEWIALERGCCPFLTFALEAEPDGGPLRIEIAGPPGTRTFVAEVMPFAGAPTTRPET